MRIYQEEIVPWLREHLTFEEISSFDLERINRIIRPTPSTFPPNHLFNNSKLLFELAHLLIRRGLGDFAFEVIKYIRSSFHAFSSYSTVLEALSFDDLILFNHILKLWFPGNVDKLLLIQNLVDLRMGEDQVIEIIDILWDELKANCSGKFLKSHLTKILLSAMRRHYVSVFEDILERLPELLIYIHQKLEYKCSLVHLFCRNMDPEALNRFMMNRRLSSYGGDSSPFDSSFDNVWLDHRSRSYPTANNDILTIIQSHSPDIINTRDCNGMTPLHFAISLKNAHIVQVLLECGANSSLTFKGKSVFELAKFYYAPRVEHVLRNHLMK